MNDRQRRYKKNRILGMSRYNAAKSAGYSESTARTHTKQLEERVKIADVLERHGLTDRVLVMKLTELLNASKVVGYLHNYKNAKKGGIEKISPDEVVSNEFIDVPDWSARAKGLELVLKLKDLLRDKIEHSGKVDGNETKIIIIRDGNKTETLAGQVCVQPETLPRAVQCMGDGKDTRPNLAGNVIQRADS